MHKKPQKAENQVNLPRQNNRRQNQLLLQEPSRHQSRPRLQKHLNNQAPAEAAVALLRAHDRVRLKPDKEVRVLQTITIPTEHPPLLNPAGLRPAEVQGQLHQAIQILQKLPRVRILVNQAQLVQTLTEKLIKVAAYNNHRTQQIGQLLALRV